MQQEKQKYPVAVFELIPVMKNGAGFVREDTISTNNPVRLIHPKNRVIMNTSVVRKESQTKPGTFVNVATRYIYNQEEIFLLAQEEAKMTTSVRDKIVFLNGLLTVPKDGAFVGLYEFLMNHAQNATNPNRIESLQPLFTELKPIEHAHDKNLYDFQLAEAIGWVKKLVTEKAGKYTYEEESIDVLCGLFGVVGDSPQHKIQGLIAVVKTDPVHFLTEAKKGQQTSIVEVQHAVKLNLIELGTTASYKGVEGVEGFIMKFSNLANTEEKRITALASYFSKEEGKEAYVLFKEKLQLAKEAAIA